MARFNCILPGDQVRVTRPEFKQRVFKVITTYYDLVEIEIGNFVHKDYVQKKYRNRYINISSYASL